MPESEVNAVIWDMDGVIADTGPYHLEAWQRVMEKRGVNFTAEDFRRNFGQRNDNIIRKTLGRQISQAEMEAVAAEKEKTFRNLVRRNVKPLPGVIKLIRLLREQGFRLAIASSGPIENIRLVLRSLGIEECFHAIVAGRDVAESKPSPQGFLLAAQKLGVKPGNCVVIEDAIVGVAACKSAGTRCVAVTNTNTRESLKGADVIVDTLEKVAVDDLARLLASSK